MTQIIQKLLDQLQRLPESMQERYASRWMHELAEEQGDGSLQIAEPKKTSMVSYADIEHLVGSIKGGPRDLASNPKYMEGYGSKSMGPDH